MTTEYLFGYSKRLSWPFKLYPMAGFFALYQKCKEWDLHKQIKGVDMSPKTKPLRRMFSLCKLTFKASQLSQFIVVVKIIPTEDIFHRISP